MTTTQTDTPTARRPRGLVHPLAGSFLLLDAVATSVNGVAYVVAGGWLADWFGAPEPLVRGAGVFLLAVGGSVAWLATRRPIPRSWVLALGILNFGWVLASLDYALLGELATPGRAWLVLQAALVAAFAACQVWLARRG
ncbi:hypothetical protein [Nocardioides piscis]|uniref:Uncharacterized protein n=1 Tax=Nocardioides piscis TaxID=2714938 RepID=A0A6G7YJ21_9ACTN|nr:hypothetical protein [Nocardioides piscis]QIK76735.1 hypothetical protein G7071_16190 [Nocardioides piscis]